MVAGLLSVGDLAHDPAQTLARVCLGRLLHDRAELQCGDRANLPRTQCLSDLAFAAVHTGFEIDEPIGYWSFRHAAHGLRPGLASASAETLT